MTKKQKEMGFLETLFPKENWVFAYVLEMFITFGIIMILLNNYQMATFSSNNPLDQIIQFIMALIILWVPMYWIINLLREAGAIEIILKKIKRILGMK